MEKLTCKKCGHTWIRRLEAPPIQCPKCRNPNWNKDKVYKDPLKTVTYKCKCGNVVVITSHLNNPMYHDHTCDKCGGTLWQIGTMQPKWKFPPHCHKCKGDIDIGEEYTTELIEKTFSDGETCRCLMLYHLACLPY